MKSYCCLVTKPQCSILFWILICWIVSLILNISCLYVQMHIVHPNRIFIHITLSLPKIKFIEIQKKTRLRHTTNKYTSRCKDIYSNYACCSNVNSSYTFFFLFFVIFCCFMIINSFIVKFEIYHFCRQILFLIWMEFQQWQWILKTYVLKLKWYKVYYKQVNIMKPKKK